MPKPTKLTLKIIQRFLSQRTRGWIQLQGPGHVKARYPVVVGSLWTGSCLLISCPCIIPSHWVCAGRPDSLLTDRTQWKGRDVYSKFITSMPWLPSCLPFLALSPLLILRGVSWHIVSCPMEGPCDKKLREASSQQVRKWGSQSNSSPGTDACQQLPKWA